MKHEGMEALDWGVIGLYFLGMLLIGWYFSRRTKTSEDYMLGGRTMKPWAVGMSLFATLLSSISYLAWPGEVIQNGPMLLCGFAAIPCVYAVVGWLLIPYIMKMKVGSAYELLEVRLGVSVRILASLFFLVMRLVWMSVIIYMCSVKVVIPLMDWPDSMAVWVSIVIGVITVVYTSMGGLRAVVTTDVIQTCILLGGAILSIIVISVRLGGVDQWMPHTWHEDWLDWKLFDTHARASLLTAMIAYFSWYVCTAGSDQMALQRYLATRDKIAARRAFLISLCLDASVNIFLGLLGLALMMFFMRNTALLPEGQSVSQAADRLFPRFIVIGLPAGITGLVIAGLMAAAMSSLSSGVNSSCLVVSRDFIERFGKQAHSQRGQVIRDRWISLGIGAVVVMLSLLVGCIQGNLLEVTYKTVNLLVAPLFVPFFMAMFVKRSSSVGVFLGTLCSVAAAVMIGFSNEFFDKAFPFIWILPGAFLTGIVSSFLMSLIFPQKAIAPQHESDRHCP